MLPFLLTCTASSGTRFGTYTSRKAPTDPANVALLLAVCSYDVRRRDVVELRGVSGTWMPAPTSLPGDPMLHLLHSACARDWPARPMYPNDERLDVVFA